MNWGDGITALGETTLKGRPVTFGIKDSDRLDDIALLGKSGQRMPYLVSLALQDVQRAVGVLLIDVTGEAAETFVERLDGEARKRLVYLDPSDAEYPFSWNPLEEYRTLGGRAPEELARLLASLYRAPASPLLSWIAAWMLNAKDATLLSPYELIAEPPMRDAYVPKSTSERTEFEELLAKETETADAVRENGRYLAKDTLVRNLLGQTASKFGMNELSEGGIIVLNLSRIRMFPTRIGPLSRLFSYAARAEASGPSAVYLNECLRTFSEEDIEYLLGERTLAVTFSESLLPPTDPVRKKALARAASVVSFSPAPADAALVESLFFPYVSASDLDKLESREMATMLAIDSVRSRPFFGKAVPLPPRQNISYQDVQVASREAFATPRHSIDAAFRKKYAPPAAAKPADQGSFSNAFRSIFSKNAAGAATPAGAPPAAQAPRAAPAPQPAPVKKPPEPSADVNKEPAEISEEELKKMLYVTPPDSGR